MDGIIETMKQLVNEFDFANFIPAVDSILGWVETLVRIFVMAAPICILAFGLYFLFLPPKEANYSAGYRTYYDLIGSGTGYYACDGKMVPIKWERPTLRDSFSYTLEDGTPVTLGVGTSYVAIIGQRGAASFE